MHHAPSSSPSSQRPAPWWRFGHVWLVISGPLVVVLASIVTVVLALRHPDPVVDADYYRKGVEINKTLGDATSSMAPAQVMRNHAATGVVPGAREATPAARP